MSEEEKKAIETLKGMIQAGGTLDSGFERGEEKIFQTILNLIDKLQKENEELRVQGSIVYLDYKTLKDKIREKIEELHKEQENEYDGMIQDFIDYLEKLLKEE